MACVLTVLPAHPVFIRWRNEPYLPLPSQPKLVLIYRPQRDGRLSWPWVAGWLHTEIDVPIFSRRPSRYQWTTDCTKHSSRFSVSGKNYHCLYTLLWYTNVTFALKMQFTSNNCLFMGYYGSSWPRAYLLLRNSVIYLLVYECTKTLTDNTYSLSELT